MQRQMQLPKNSNSNHYRVYGQRIDRVPPDVGLAPSTAGGPSPLPLPCTLGPLPPHQDWVALSRSIAKRDKGG